jgi:hypothetical protein
MDKSTTQGPLINSRQLEKVNILAQEIIIYLNKVQQLVNDALTKKVI